MTLRLVLATTLLLFPPLAEAATLKIGVARAEAGTDAYSNQPIVTIELEPESRDDFAAFTKARIGEPVRIRMGDKILSAPVVREPITGGVLVISGQMTLEDARHIAKTLIESGASLMVDGSDASAR